MNSYESYVVLRDQKGVTDSDVARCTGITRPTFSDWKNGKYTPKIPKMMKIAEYFGVPLEKLIGG